MQRYKIDSNIHNDASALVRDTILCFHRVCAKMYVIFACSGMSHQNKSLRNKDQRDSTAGSEQRQ